MKKLSILLISLLILSCSEEKEELTAASIVDKAIEASGGARYEKAEIDFVFRNREYKSIRKGGEYSFQRRMKDSLGNVIQDVLNNEGLTRYKNDTVVKVVDSMVVPVSNAVNSVHYFVQLPYGLNAPAAKKELIGKDSIAGKEYYEVKVTFAEEGGGTDHEDEYMYWIDTNNFQVDYLAYNFETNDGGIRFRKAFNPRLIEGIRFVDYENYKYDDLSTPLEELDSLYEERKLELLSIIETQNIRVKSLDDA